MVLEEHDAADRHDRLEAEGRRAGLSRRQALAWAGGAGLGLLVPGGVARAASSGLRQAPAAPAGPGILKPLDPQLLIARGTNAEMRFGAMCAADYLTPVSQFFVRNHTRTPRIDARTWRLRVYGTGLRGRPGLDEAISFSLKQLKAMPQTTITCAVECAGNARAAFGTQQGTPAPGTQWTLGAVGVAEWTGVLLSEVLERAGVTRQAVDVQPEGLDDPVVDATYGPQGHVRRPFSIAKAQDDVLLAYAMNGQDLPADHGFPLRAVVPGWVGVASTKWVGSIRVASKPLRTPWNTVSYRMVGPTYPADAPPLTTQPLKSAFELDPGAAVPAGQLTTLRGRAWSGRSRPRSVDVSTDGGQTFAPARLIGPNAEHGWVRFAFDWTPAQAGPVEIAARATDQQGIPQPFTVPFNANGYQYAAVVRQPVRVVG